MATTTQEIEQFWISTEAIDQEGVIDFYDPDRGFGYISIDTAPQADRYWCHFKSFPKDQQNKIRLGKRVRFSAEGGQRLALYPKKNWPRVSDVTLLSNPKGNNEARSS